MNKNWKFIFYPILTKFPWLIRKEKKLKKFKKNYKFNFDLEMRDSFDKIQNL